MDPTLDINDTLFLTATAEGGYNWNSSYRSKTDDSQRMPEAPLCQPDADAYLSDPKAANYWDLCQKLEIRLHEYEDQYVRRSKGETPGVDMMDIRQSNLECARQNLALLNEMLQDGANLSLPAGDRAIIEGMAREASYCIQTLYMTDASEDAADAEMLEEMRNNLEYVHAGLAIIGVAASAAAFIAASVYGAAFLTDAAAMPLLSEVSAPGIGTAVFKGVNDFLLSSYGVLALAHVAGHTLDEPGAPVAQLPGEALLGSDARPLLGALGVGSITYLLGYRLFGLSPQVCTTFVITDILVDYITQHNSNDVAFKDLDWSRVYGGAVSALVIYGPTNWLWNGIGPWAGWANRFPSAGPLPSTKAVAGFIASTGIVNSALFVPIALWLERANPENFWEGLTIREFTLAVPRKTAQTVLNTNSIPSIIIYTGSKAVENDVISNFYSLFAGSGLYRSSLHKFLAENHTAEEFVEECKEALGSLNFSLKNNAADEAIKKRSIYAMFENEPEPADYALLAEDISGGLFSDAEVKKITGYVNEILRDGVRFDEEAEKIAKAWQAVLVR